MPMPMPIAPKALPLVGHIGPFLRDPLAFLSTLPAHGPLVRIKLGPMAAVVVCDPALTRQVLVNDRVFDKGGPLYDRAREMMGDGLITCPYTRHRRQRRLVQPAFHSSRMPGYARAMSEQIGIVTESWRAGQELDVLAETMTITSRTVLATLVSDGLPADALSEACSDTKELFAGLYRQMLTPPPLHRLPLPANLRYQRARARMRKRVESIVAERRAEGTDNGDLLSALLFAGDESESDGLTDIEVRDQVLSFLLAGTESSATTLGWALHQLSQHPDVEQRLQEEVDAVLGGRTAELGDLPRLPVTEQVITETLRLHTPAWFLTRTVTEDTTLGGYDLRAGSTVAFSPYLVQRTPSVYEAPDDFVPERWSDDDAKMWRRESYLPFANGARKCIGDTFGLTMSVLALATIVGRWRLTSLGPVRAAASSVLTPQGLRMRCVARATTRSADVAFDQRP